MSHDADNTLSEPDAVERRGPRRWLAPVLIAAAFFAAIAPTLPWLEFAGGSENLVVETVLEMRRGGPWFIPTLQGYPRLSKPPLAVWIAAAAARPDTVRRLSSRDPDARHAAFRAFSWEVRWPSLLSACGMLLATCALGDLLLGRSVGLASMVVCGSSLLFLRFCRSATTDVQLALWVTAANALLALALLRRRHWLGFAGAGVALGLSLMSKGPVGLVQSVLPFALFALWRRVIAPRRRAPGTVAPALAGALLMLAIALPWPAVVFLKSHDIWQSWLREITRAGATQLAPDPWYYYLVFFAWMLPWLSFLVAGTWTAMVSLVQPSVENPPTRREGFVLALLLTLVPIVVMSCAKDKVERYLLPMAAPASVLAAGALVQWFGSDRRDPRGRAVEVFHWGTLVAFAAAPAVIALVPGRFGLDEGRFDLRPGIAFGAAALVLLAGYLLVSRRRPMDVPAPERSLRAAAFTAALVLLLQYPILLGYRRVSTSDLRPLAEVVWAQYPDALLYEYEPGTRTRSYYDLPIYAGRISRKTSGPASMPPTDRPQVVVFFHRQGEPPTLAPPWKELASGGGRKDRWRAFVLPAKE